MICVTACTWKWVQRVSNRSNHCGWWDVSVVHVEFSASTSVWSILYSLIKLKLWAQPYLFSIYGPWVWFHEVFSSSQVGCSDCSLRTGLRLSWIFQPVSNFYKRICFQNKLQLYFRKNRNIVSSYLTCLYIDMVSLGISPALICTICAKCQDRYCKREVHYI